MAKQAADHHKKAAEHHEKAVHNHKEASNGVEANQHEKAAHSRDHQEWLVDVAPHGEGSSASQEPHGLPFEALTLHLDHTDEVLSIIVRKNHITQEHDYQSIPRPRRVMIERTGADVRLRIDSTEGSSTIIRFRRVATPDYDAGT